VNVLALVLMLAGRVVFSFADPQITESSGLVDLGGLMVTTNDSGDDAVLYVVDPSTGRTVGHTRYAPEVSDVEALAPAGPGEVWAADIGDNREVRPSVRVYRVPVGRGERRVRAASYRLVYPDGPHDAESLVAAGGRLYVITKGLLGGTVYVTLPRLGETNRLRRAGSVDLFATDAALLTDRRHVLVRGYDSAEVLTFPGFRPVSSFALPDQPQGEGVSVGPGDRIRLSSEGVHSRVLQIGLPHAVPKPKPTPTPRPAVGTSDGSAPLLPGALVGLAAAGVAAAIGVTGWWRYRHRRPR
jgi:hypothetical protein